MDSASNVTKEPSPHDIFIPVLGLAGSGKSRFIALCTGEAPREGDTAFSIPGTPHFTIHPFTHPAHPTLKIHLIDTPSFDAPGHDHDAILAQHTYWLLKSFHAGIRITGVVYTFPVDAMRLTGSARRALDIAKAMVGEENASATCLVTTMWDRVADKAVGEERVAELMEDGDFWGGFYAAGGFVEPVTMGDRRSALRVVSLLLGGVAGSAGKDGGEGRVLRIQRQMGVDKMKLYETDAGRIAWGGIVDEKHRLEAEMEDVRGEVMGLIRQPGREVDKIQALEGRADGMRMEGGELTAMWDFKVRNEMKQLRLELARNQDLLEDLEGSVREGMAGGRYQDKGQRQELEKEMQKVRKKVEELQRVEKGGRVAMDVFFTGGRVIGGGLGIAAAVVPLAACSVM